MGAKRAPSRAATPYRAIHGGALGAIAISARHFALPARIRPTFDRIRDLHYAHVAGR
jgi:hypothetical protein